ncbi:hypothetical protein W7U_02320 [Mycobacterium sp. H4Y]|nr:hypothetical protein W7U_02320 [Mycobacterium sp. H4Y]
MARIALIGGHGKVALQLAQILTERGDDVSSVFRNPDHASDVAATGAKPVTADIERLDTDALAGLLAGHDAVVFSAGAGGGNPARTYAVDRDAAIRVIDAAAQAGVTRFVMVSYFGAGPDHGVPQDDPFFAYAEAKAAADAHLRASDLDWTVLGRAGSPSSRRPGASRWTRARARFRAPTSRRWPPPRWRTTPRSVAPSSSTTATSRSPRHWLADPVTSGVSCATQLVCRHRTTRRRHRARHVRHASQEGTRWESGTVPQRYAGTTAVTSTGLAKRLGSDGH